MRLALAALALFGSATGAAAQDDPSLWRVRCGGAFQMCGHVEPQNEAPRIAFRYEKAKPFRDGLAPVRIHGRWGYIDTRGEWAIEPVFTDAAPFRDRYAEVRIDGAAVIIDRNGRTVLDGPFARIIPFSGDVFIAEPLAPNQTARDLGGDLGTVSDLFELSGLRRVGLYHRTQGWVTEPDLELSLFDDLSRGLVWAARRNGRNEQVWGLMRADGSWRINPRFSHVQGLTGGRAVVQGAPDDSLTSATRREGDLSGAVDETGELVIPPQFEGLSYWRGGYGVARRQAAAAAPGHPSVAPGRGLVAPDGTLLGGRYFDEVSVSEESGRLPRVRLDGVWRSIRADGALLPDQLEGTLLFECPGGPAFIHRGDKLEVRRPNGTTIGLYDQSNLLSRRNCSGPFSLTRSDRWFILTPDGAVLGGERGFENLYASAGDHTGVQIDGEWGIIDRSGRFTVPPQFDRLTPHAQGVYKVEQGGATRWINATGQTIEAPKLRPDPATALVCAGGLALFEANGLWGLRDEEARIVIRPEYRVLSCFQNGVAWAVSPADRSWKAIGPDGRPMAALPEQRDFYPIQVSHHSPERFDEDPFESSVLWNLAHLHYLAGTRAEPPRWVSHRRGGAGFSSLIR